MNKYLKVFEKHASHLKYDDKLMKNIKRFKYRWMNSSTTNVEFLSSNLIGVHPIRFTEEHEDEFFNDVLDIDKDKYYDDLIDIAGLNKKWIVSSNPLYNACITLMHKFYKSKNKEENILDVVRDLYLIMTYKIISSLTVQYFQYPLDIDLAYTVYEKINKRSLIKRYDSWENVFLYKSEDVLPGGLHYKNILTLDDKKSVYIINDIQGRYRSMYKELYEVIMEIKNEETKRTSRTLSGKDMEGTDIIENVDDANAQYFQYIKSIIYERENFVKMDIVYIIDKMFKNIKINELLLVLNYLSDNYLKDKERIDRLVEDSLEANINYLHVVKMYPPYDIRIIAVIKHLKGLWSSSKVKDPNLLSAKWTVYEITKEVTGKKTKWLLVSLGMGVGVYIFLRAILKNTYK